MKMKILLAIVFILTCSVVVCAADSSKPKFGPKGPVNSVDGILYPSGQVGVIFKTVFFDKDTRYDGGDKVSIPANNPNSKEMWVNNLVLRYGLMKNLELRGKFTYKDMSLGRQTPANPNSPDYSNSGMGDSVVRLRYQLLSQKAKDSVSLWAGVGLNVPTGDSDTRTNGKLNPMSWQLGDDSWDPIIDGAITKQINKLKLNAYASYTFNQEGDRDWKWGDVLQLDVSSVYALNPWIGLEAELNYVHTGKAENNGVKVNSIGGSQLYFTPGIHFMCPGKKHHIALGVPITIYRDLNGSTQLSEDYRVVLKAAFAF